MMKVILEANDMLLGIDTAAQCDFLVSELMSNALKYAFPGRRNGTIGFEIQGIDESLYQFILWDAGIGLPTGGVNVRKPSSLGLQLVYSLSASLATRLEFTGTRFIICFQKAMSKLLSNLENGV